MTPAADPDVLEWHRASVLGRVLVLWAVGVVCEMVGLVGTGVALTEPINVHPSWYLPAALVGFPAAVMGPLTGIVGVLWVLTRDEPLLVVTRAGLRLDAAAPGDVWAWRSLSHVAVEGAGPRRRLCLTVTTEDGAESRVRLPGYWTGISAQALADRLIEIKRRALLGVFRLPERTR